MANVFFSWQSDRPPSTGRNFVARALELSVNAINRELLLISAERELIEVDQDTRGMSGSPLIFEAIFDKIDGCRAFVADLTFVGKRPNGELMPNSNVLIEYGWALKAIKRAAIIGVMNTAYGDPGIEHLPFDLRAQRFPIRYRLEEGADEATRRSVRADLVRQLKSAIEAVVASETKAPAPPQSARFEPRVAADEGGRLVAADVSWGIRFDLGQKPNQKVFLEDGPVAWLRLYPKYIGNEGGLDLLNGDLEPLVRATGPARVDPLVAGSEQSFFRRPDGVGIYALRGKSDHVPGLALVFNNGEIWAADRFIMEEREGDSVELAEPLFFKALDRFMSVYRTALCIDLPWVWQAGVEGLEGKYLLPAVSANSFPAKKVGPATHDRVSKSGEIVDGQARARDVLRPFIEAVYDAFGSRAPAWLFMN